MTYRKFHFILQIDIPFTYPLGHNDGFDGFANCVDLKAHIYDGVKCNEAPIYDDKKDKVFELYNAIAEEVAKTDDALLEKFFAGEDLFVCVHQVVTMQCTGIREV